MLIKLGNWFFHYRNILFPVFYAALFIPSMPVFEGDNWPLLLGIFIICLGIATRCITIGLVYVIRGGNKRTIHAETLVTEGIYNICRNPMYLGNVLLIIGFGLFANSLLFVALFTPVFIFIYFAITKAEEDFLFKKFGQQYQEYKGESNSFLPNLLRIKEATLGHRFNISRVITKEYNSLFLYLSGILVILCYDYNMKKNTVFVVFSIMLIMYLYIKWLKKKKIL